MLSLTVMKKSFRSVFAISIAILVVTIGLFLLGFMAAKVSSGLEDGTYFDKKSVINTASQTIYQPLGMILFGLFAIMLPMILVSKEIENTSLAILLVSKNSRTNIILSKYATMFLILFIYFLIQMVLGMGVFGPYFKGDEMAQFVNLNWLYFMGTVVLMTITFFSTIYFKKRSSIWMLAGGILIASIGLNMVGELMKYNAVIKNFKYISIFAFADLEMIMKNNAISIIPYVVGFASIGGIVYGAVELFKRKDLQL